MLTAGMMSPIPRGGVLWRGKGGVVPGLLLKVGIELRRRKEGGGGMQVQRT